MTSIFLHGNKTWDKPSTLTLTIYIFEMFFNQELRRHLVHKTLQYAKVSYNDTSFTFSENELRKYIGVLIFSGYHRFKGFK